MSDPFVTSRDGPQETPPPVPAVKGSWPIMGVDPGLVNTGYAILDGLTALPLDIGVFSTKPASKKRRLHASDDLTSRVTDIVDGLQGKILEHGVQFVGMEVHLGVYKMNAGAMLKVAAVAGSVMGLVRGMGLPPLCCVHRADISKVVGRKNASKQDIKDFVTTKWPHIVWPCKTRKEHASDASAVALAVLARPEIVALKNLAETLR